MEEKQFKSRLNILFILSLIVVMGMSIFFMNGAVKSYASSVAVKQAKEMTHQLMIVRNYLAKNAPIDDGFMLTPAYVGSHISKVMNQEQGIYFKQTSLEYRNPENKPDKYEKIILQKYLLGELEGKFWEVTDFNKEETLRYTTPLYIEQNCLRCHGEPYVDVKKEVYEKLVSQYGDRSFNYKIGDLRGSVSIAIPMEQIYKENAKLYTIAYGVFAFIIILFIVYTFIEKEFIIKPSIKDIEYKKLYLDTVVESNNSAIIAIDGSGKITTYNKMAEVMFGWSKDEMLAKRNLLKIIPDKYKDIHEKALKNYLMSGKSIGIIDATHELSGLRKNGEIFPIEISFGAKYDDENSIVIANISDITHRKSLETELMQLNNNLNKRVEEEVQKNYEKENQLIQQSRLAQMGEMIAMIAHQWRQPLASISSTVGSLQMKQALGKYNQEFYDKQFQNIADFTQHLSSTIEDFRNFFKEEKQQSSITIESIVEGSISIIKPLLESKNIIIKTDFQSNETLHTFSNELKQVILNILKNAQEVLEEKNINNPKISISTYKDEDYLYFEIEDNAGGIPADIMSKIFDPYFTTKGKLNGTGLGLYMSQKIIQEHCNGTLSVRNSGDGAVFIGKLPKDK